MTIMHLAIFWLACAAVFLECVYRAKVDFQMHIQKSEAQDMTPEERAVEALSRITIDYNESYQWAKDNVASAIRAAENAALERAAEYLNHVASDDIGSHQTAIRALKHSEAAA